MDLFGLYNLVNFTSFAGNLMGHLFPSFFGNVSIPSVIGTFIGGAGLIVGSVLLIKQAITGDEGFKTIKQIAVFAMFPAVSVLVAQLINLSFIGTSLTNFLIIIRHLLYQWNFFLDIPFLLSLLTMALTMLGGYWLFKSYTFFADFFNQR